MIFEDLYGRLLEKINFLEISSMYGYKSSIALRAVVELHKPKKVTHPDVPPWFICVECSDYTGQSLMGYPCPTTTAIEKAIDG